MSEERIAKALGLRPLEEVRKEEPDEIIEDTSIEEQEVLPVEINDGEILPAEKSNYSQEPLDDIEFARNNIKELLNKGTDSLDELITLAKQSESPRAFEVVSTMMKTMLDANKEFVDMSQKKKYEQEDTGSVQSQTNVTNNNLILSTTDLLKMMKGEIDG